MTHVADSSAVVIVEPIHPTLLLATAHEAIDQLVSPFEKGVIVGQQKVGNDAAHGVLHAADMLPTHVQGHERACPNDLAEGSNAVDVGACNVLVNEHHAKGDISSVDNTECASAEDISEVRRARKTTSTRFKDFVMEKVRRSSRKQQLMTDMSIGDQWRLQDCSVDLSVPEEDPTGGSERQRGQISSRGRGQGRGSSLKRPRGTGRPRGRPRKRAGISREITSDNAENHWRNGASGRVPLIGKVSDKEVLSSDSEGDYSAFDALNESHGRLEMFSSNDENQLIRVDHDTADLFLPRKRGRPRGWKKAFQYKDPKALERIRQLLDLNRVKLRPTQDGSRTGTLNDIKTEPLDTGDKTLGRCGSTSEQESLKSVKTAMSTDEDDKAKKNARFNEIMMRMEALSGPEIRVTLSRVEVPSGYDYINFCRLDLRRKVGAYV